MRRTAGLAALLLAALLASACGLEPASGPGRVAWDRDTCERCQMTISDHAFAAQLRTRDGRLHRFDDVGCALVWERDEGADVTETWVRALEGDTWLDAGEARFVKVRNSPMGYGFGARRDDAAGIGLAALREQILALEDERRRPAH